MEQLCGEDKYWDTELTWTNNSWPQLTECFENTALTLIPCGYLLLVSPFYVWYLVHAKISTGRPFGKLFILKQLFSILILVLLVADLANSAGHTLYFNDEILSHATWIAVMILHVVLVNVERTRDVSRFPVLFLFWLLGSVVLLMQVISASQKGVYGREPFHFTMLTFRYLISNLLLLLHCFSSYSSQKYKETDNPYQTASLPSIMYLCWVDPLLWKGYKKPLQDNNLYSLTQENTTLSVMSKFHRSWEKETKRSKVRRRKKPKTVPVEEIDACTIPLQSQTQEGSHWKSSHTEKSNDGGGSSLSQPSLLKALLSNFWFEFIASGFGKMGRVADGVLNPLVLGLFIDYISNQELTWHGYIYTAVILLLKVVNICLSYPSTYSTYMFAIRVQSAIMGAVFRKSLTVSSESRKETTSGEIINLMSADAAHIKMVCDYLYWTWLSVTYFVVGIALTVTIAGLAILPGLGCILLIFIMNINILHKQRIYQDGLMHIKDERVKTMNEILNGIKVIKLYGWENIFIKKVTDVREKELKILLKSSILDAIFNFAWRGALFWMNYFILVTYVMIDDSHYLDAKTAFVTLSYINLVRLAVNIMPIMGQFMIKATSSLRRLDKFMNAEDILTANLERDTSDRLSVRIENGDFSWEKHGNTILKSINLEVQPGKLIAVVGTVGSGKSSLLSAMLGEMHRIQGYVNLNSSIAYVPQVAWIQNATVKNNILFGSPFRQDMYDRAIKSCCLETDLNIMAAGDQTEIGEKGINLSGGQKQRVSLARAVYSQADIYLLDDPLSAVDSHVGRHMFDEVIGPNGCLRGKTRILVTHGVQWLPEVDQIIVMNSGRICESGTMDQLLAQNGDFAKFLTQYFVQHGNLGEKEMENIDTDDAIKTGLLQRLISVASVDSDGGSVKDTPVRNGVQRHMSVASADDIDIGTPVTNLGEFLSHDLRLSTISLHQMSRDLDSVRVVGIEDTKAGKVDASRLTTDEGASGGRVSSKLYWHLWKSVGRGYTAIIVFFILAYHVTYNLANYWIAAWNDDEKLSNHTELPANSTARLDRNTHFIVIFTVIGLMQTVSVLGFSLIWFIRHVAACRYLHAKLLQGVLQAPMSFFDTTPIGRILNRFSQDIQIIDKDIFYELSDFIDFFLKAIGILITISINQPWILVVVFPILFLIAGVQRLFVVNSCQVRRLASNKSSPIYAHFSETLSGASVIRAYRAQEQFITESNRRIDDFQKASSAVSGFLSWLYSRFDTIAMLVVGGVFIFAILTRDQLTPGIIGLSVSYSIEMAIILCLGFEMLGYIETHIVSVERVREYSVVKSEAPWTTPEDNKTLGNDDTHTHSTWPSKGTIEFYNYSTRYREGLDLVLKGMTCTITGGEKVGIVGRTGAGKSSMVLSLFRLIEAVGGKIVIDGVDIAHIGLHTLRHHITILPQDPVLFAGSLRMNLDPQDEKTDAEIWTALEHSYLKDFVSGLDNKLNHNVGEHGENFSLGQRQLLCLARTLLRKTKILVLDEATASVDMDTDDLIQKTIRTEFSDCTILTIAHRLNTVMDYDRLMVLDSGNIKEFDTPSSLLSDSSTAFYSMAQEAGLVGKES